MKRFASHYLYISAYGFFKQYVIEINGNGYVAALYPLREEAESIIWTPGVISFITPSQLHETKKEEEWKEGNIINFEQKQIKTELPAEFNKMDALKLTAVRLYPFNFTQMQPAENTVLQVLNNRTF